MIRGVTSSRVCDNQPSGVNDTRSYATTDRVTINHRCMDG